jgi:hypothetical protein
MQTAVVDELDRRIDEVMDSMAMCMSDRVVAYLDGKVAALRSLRDWMLG